MGSIQPFKLFGPFTTSSATSSYVGQLCGPATSMRSGDTIEDSQSDVLVTLQTYFIANPGTGIKFDSLPLQTFFYRWLFFFKIIYCLSGVP